MDSLRSAVEKYLQDRLTSVHPPDTDALLELIAQMRAWEAEAETRDINDRNAREGLHFQRVVDVVILLLGVIAIVTGLMINRTWAGNDIPGLSLFGFGLALVGLTAGRLRSGARGDNR